MFRSKKSGDDDPATTVKSMDAVNDFELVPDNEKKEADADKGTDEQKEKYEKLMQKMKDEIRPLKEELANDQKVLHKLHSHLVDESAKRNSENKDDKTTEYSDTDQPDKDVQMRYKISSVKYDLMKKDKLIEDLEKKIKSFHDKVEQISLDTELSSNTGIQILKRELELNDEVKFSLNDNKILKQLDLHVNEQLITPFARLFMVSCFHVINAVLIVTLLSVYYSRDSDSEKQYTIAAIAFVYLVVNVISMYLIQFHLAQLGSFFFSYTERKSKLFQHSVALAACTLTCILMVYQVSMRYEDASTFFYSMLYLMGFCMFANFVLAMVVCKIFEGQPKMANKSTKKQDWEEEERKRLMSNDQENKIQQSIKNDESREKQ